MAPKLVVGGCAEVTRGSAFDKGEMLVVDKVSAGRASTGGPQAQVLVFAAGMKGKAQELAGFLGDAASRRSNTRAIDALKLLSHTSVSMTMKEVEKATRFAEDMGKVLFKPPTAPEGPDLSGMKLQNVPLISGSEIHFCDTATVKEHDKDDMWHVVGDDGKEGRASEATIKRCKASDDEDDDDDTWDSRPVKLTGGGAKLTPLVKQFRESKATPAGTADPVELMAVLVKFVACQPMVSMAKDAKSQTERDALLQSGANVLTNMFGMRPFPAAVAAASPAALGAELVRLASAEVVPHEVEASATPRAAALRALASSEVEWKKAEKRIINTIAKEDADNILEEQVFIDKKIDNYLSVLTVAHIAGKAEKGALKWTEIVTLFYDLQHECSKIEKTESKSDEASIATALAEALKQASGSSKGRLYESGLSASENAHLSKLKQSALNIFKDKAMEKRLYAMQTLADAGQLESLSQLINADPSEDIQLVFQSACDNPEKHLSPILEPEQFTALHAVRNAVQLRFEREIYGEKRVPDIVSKQFSRIISRRLTKIRLLELVNISQTGDASEPLVAFAKLGEDASLSTFLQSMSLLQDGFFHITPIQSLDVRITIRAITDFVTKYRTLGASWKILSPWLYAVFSRIEKASSSHATPTAPLSWDAKHVKDMTEFREDFMNAFNLEMQSKKAPKAPEKPQKPSKRPLDKVPDGAEQLNKSAKGDPAEWKSKWAEACEELAQAVKPVDDVKACAFHFIKGKCKHGDKCRFHHKGKAGGFKKLMPSQGNGA